MGDTRRKAPSRAAGERAMRAFPLALAPYATSQSCRLLNRILADSTILYNLYKKHHWLVRGPDFYEMHLLLDKHAEEQLKIIDLVGQRIHSLGGVAVADPRHVAEVATVPRPPDGVEQVPAMLSRLLEAHDIVIGKVREAIGNTAATRDDGTTDLLLGEVLRTNELHVWFVAEHLVNLSSPQR
ncbi:MAG: hypothetical protein JWO67_2726 [Streptosporangiaceae bacterium]|nr:hypothetical protein [Streptosporangiaceae bacterium]